MFQVGDFILPFEISGGLCLVIGIIAIWRLPKLVGSSFCKSSITSDSSSTYQSSLSSFKEMLSDSRVLLALFGTVFGAVCQGFIETYLETYLELFGLSVSQIGVSFLGNGFFD